MRISQDPTPKKTMRVSELRVRNKAGLPEDVQHCQMLKTVRHNGVIYREGTIMTDQSLLELFWKKGFMYVNEAAQPKKVEMAEIPITESKEEAVEEVESEKEDTEEAVEPKEEAVEEKPKKKTPKKKTSSNTSKK